MRKINNSSLIVVMITVPDKDVGEKIAKELLEKKLAACVNLIPSISSIYTWEGDVCYDDEVLMIVKSRSDLFDTHLVPAVQSAHPYDVPEIIALPIQHGARSYLEWFYEVTLDVQQ